MVPPTRKTQVRGPLASAHARSDPEPESFKLVTSYTAPPRPPTEPAPPPSAPGKAASGPPGVGGAFIVTVVEACLLASALLVAVTVAVPAAEAAVNSPLASMLPAEAVHFTDLSVAVPWTVAVN